MSTIPEIEKAIQELPPQELAKFRAWFAEFDVAQWDQQISDDVSAGRLDSLGREAIEDFRNGRTRKL